MTIAEQLNLSELNLDGSHVIAKKGGESVAYQGRKKAKTTNILPITDGQGFIVASTGLVAGNHNDAFELKENLQTAFKSMKRLGLKIAGAFFNADKAFDTKGQVFGPNPAASFNIDGVVRRNFHDFGVTL